MVRWIFTLLLVPLVLSAEEGREQEIANKVARLFCVPIAPREGNKHYEALKKLFEQYPIGSVLVKQASPEEQLEMLAWIDSIASIQPLVMSDAEWGLGMRMDRVMSFPRNLTLGAIQDRRFLYQFGFEVAKQARAVRIDMNLAPVIDVNTNPNNPIIHTRSFGEDPEKVAACGRAVMEGMLDGGLLVALKHFPGHGDVAVDPHLDLPLVTLNYEELEKTHLLPFRVLAEKGASAIMSAHILVPSLTKEEKMWPITLAPGVSERIVRDEWQYNGLLVTDALNMKALTNYFSYEEIAIRAFCAGHDILLYGDHIAPNIASILSEQVPRAIHALTRWVIEHELEEELDQRIERIEKAQRSSKYEASSLEEILFSKEAKSLRKQLFKEAVTLIGDSWKNEGEVTLAILGEKNRDCFEEILRERDYHFERGESNHMLVVVLDEGYIEEVQRLQESTDTMTLCYFGSPYFLHKMTKTINSIYLGYENDPDAIEAVLSYLLREEIPPGQLPISIPERPFY